MSAKDRMSWLALACAAIVVLLPSAPAADAATRLTVTGPSSASPGASLTYRVAVRNTGPAALRRYRVELLLSRDRRLDGNDRLLKRTTLPTLRRRRSVRRTLRGRLPSSTSAGTRQILVCVRPRSRSRTRPVCVARRLTVRGKPGPGQAPPPAPGAAAGTQQGGAASGGGAAAGGGAGAGPGTQLEPPAPGPTDPVAADPATLAPALARSQPTSIADGTTFLYTGANAIQDGMVAGTIEERRAAVLRGRVTNRLGAAIGGVRVTVADHPEYGQTATQADGGFDMVVNGGGPLTLVYERAGYIPAQRLVDVPWEAYADVDPVVLVPYSDQSTLIDAESTAETQVAQGDVVTDSDGTRQATLVFPQGTTATMQTARRGTQQLDDFRVRVTEYTIGATGPAAMPGPLPPTSGYTYAAEFSVDEAVAAGATEVTFDKPVVSYNDNFLGLPVGAVVPSAYYDRERERWIGIENGRVIKVLSDPGGTASVDVDGDGAADGGAELTALGIDDAELRTLAGLYDAGKELMRVRIRHFSPIDNNHPFTTDPDANGPDSGNPDDDDDQPCWGEGSVLYCESMALGERLPITGSRMQLVYRSDRVPGRTAARTLDVPLTGATLPTSPDFEAVELEVDVAGQTFTEHFEDPVPNMVHRFAWDGLDAYGRPVQGGQPATVRIGYSYRGRYTIPEGIVVSDWALFAADIAAGEARQRVTLWQEHEVDLGVYDTSGFGLGGWTLDVQHSYDPTLRELVLGSGEEATVDPGDYSVLENFAGKFPGGFGGDEGPAADALLDAPSALARGADGSVYVADLGNERIRRIAPDGEIDTYAGTGTYGFAGDGGQATAARISNPRALAMDEHDALLIADSGANRLRRVNADGTITTIAGGGQPADGVGDGGPATQARLSLPSGVVVSPDGRIYVSDTLHHRVRVIGTDGVITTVAGTGVPGASGDGGPAGAARLNRPRGLAVDEDGNLLVADTGNGRIRQIGVDGLVSTVAGGGDPADGLGDGLDATAAELAGPSDVDVLLDGSILVLDDGHVRVRQIAQDGTISTLAGGGLGSDEDGEPAPAAAIDDAGGLATSPDGTAFISIRSIQSVNRIRPLLEGFSQGDILIASADGSRVFQFTPEGRHQRTLDALTGGVIHEFAYDAQGRLTGVSDPQGDLLTVERAGDGTPQALVARGGQRTELTVDGGGYLASVENPAGEAVGLDHDAGGLLEELVEPSGDEHAFEYDDDGRLISDEGPGGLVQELERTVVGDTTTVTVTTGDDRVRTYLDEDLPGGERRRTVTDWAGAQTVSTWRPDGSVSLVRPDGTDVESRSAPDPRFGMEAPVWTSEEEVTPDGLNRSVTHTRTLTLDDPNTLGTSTDVYSVNGRETTVAYTNEPGPGGKLVTTTAEGRTSEAKLDGQGRLVEATFGDGTLPIALTYDARGRLAKAEQGDREWVYGFDGDDRLVSRTDALGHGETYEYDLADRRTKTTTELGHAWTWGYDDDGNRTSVETPLGHDYALGVTPDGLIDTTALPGAGTYDRSYSPDRLMTGRTEPSGAAQTWGTDDGGRLTSMTAPETASGFGYAGDTQRVTTATWNTGGGAVEQTLTQTFDGLVPKSLAFTGRAAGTYEYVSDDDLEVSSFSVDAAGEERTYAITRDDDRLATAVGPWTVGRDDDTGDPTSYTDGDAVLEQGFDGHRMLSSRSLRHDTTERYDLAITRDNAGRITKREETADGVAHVFDYVYDDDGRLTQVERDDVVVESYAYDNDGNRTTGGATYDAQDRITQLGATTYTYDGDGFLDGRGAADFDYGRRGELLRAQVAGDDVTYDYDPFGRLVRRQDGADSTQFLYGNPDNAVEVTATIDEAGALTTYFYDETGTLRALDREGERYSVASDQVGTPHVVMDDAGAVVKNVARDSWGVVLSDSAPAFELPIGFAGGIEDPATGLVRFGMRDYDLASGRWTSRDPSFFAGSPMNMYLYVENDPVSRTDPTGLTSVGGWGGLGLGLGFELSWDPATGQMGACGEAGMGLGMGAGVDWMGNPEEGKSWYTEMGAEVAGVGVTVNSRNDPCGNWEIGATTGAGPFSVGAGIGSDGIVPKGGFGGGSGVGIKSGTKWCTAWGI